MKLILGLSSKFILSCFKNSVFRLPGAVENTFSAQLGWVDNINLIMYPGLEKGPEKGLEKGLKKSEMKTAHLD